MYFCFSVGRVPNPNTQKNLRKNPKNTLRVFLGFFYEVSVPGDSLGNSEQKLYGKMQYFGKEVGVRITTDSMAALTKNTLENRPPTPQKHPAQTHKKICFLDGSTVTWADSARIPWVHRNYQQCTCPADRCGYTPTLCHDAHECLWPWRWVFSRTPRLLHIVGRLGIHFIEMTKWHMCPGSYNRNE